MKKEKDYSTTLSADGVKKTEEQVPTDKTRLKQDFFFSIFFAVDAFFYSLSYGKANVTFSGCSTEISNISFFRSLKHGQSSLIETRQKTMVNLKYTPGQLFRHNTLWTAIYITLSAFPHPTQAMGILCGRPTSCQRGPNSTATSNTAVKA